MVVENEFNKNGFNVTSVTLGQVETKNDLSEKEIDQVKSFLEPLGFKLITEKKSQIVEKIKNTIIEIIHHSQEEEEEEEEQKTNLSTLLSDLLNLDYKYLSQIFSDHEGETIEKYYIKQKTEKVKELLEYDELNLKQIADKLGYSSTAHLSNQFKKTTGITPSEFKNQNSKARNPLDKL